MRALYFTPQDLQNFQHGGGAVPANRAALVVTVADDAGRPLGITLVAFRHAPASVAGIRLRATLGTYPALAIAAAPPAWALGAGIALFVLGCGWAALGLRARRAAALSESPASAS